MQHSITFLLYAYKEFLAILPFVAREVTFPSGLLHTYFFNVRTKIELNFRCNSCLFLHQLKYKLVVTRMYVPRANQPIDGT